MASFSVYRDDLPLHELISLEMVLPFFEIRVGKISDTHVSGHAVAKGDKNSSVVNIAYEAPPDFIDIQLRYRCDFGIFDRK